MKDDHTVSEEFLNAFVDDQLDATEKSRAFDAISRDETLSARVCELRGLKEMVQHAYRHPPAGEGRSAKKGRRLSSLQALAAGLLLAIGGISGWLAHTWMAAGEEGTARLFQTAQLADARTDPRKIILHIGSSNPAKLKTALDETERLLETYKRAKRQLQLEVIANGSGLDLLRADVSPYSRRIDALRAKYPNLELLACRQTIERLQEKGVDVRLLPDTGIAPSALDQIVLRLQQGWAYIRV